MTNEVKDAIIAFRSLATHYPPDDSNTDFIMGDLIEQGLTLANYIENVESKKTEFVRIPINFPEDTDNLTLVR